LPSFLTFTNSDKIDLKKFILGISDEAVNLLEKMIELCPAKRITAKDAL